MHPLGCTDLPGPTLPSRMATMVHRHGWESRNPSKPLCRNTIPIASRRAPSFKSLYLKRPHTASQGRRSSLLGASDTALRLLGHVVSVVGVRGQLISPKPTAKKVIRNARGINGVFSASRGRAKLQRAAPGGRLPDNASTPQQMFGPSRPNAAECFEHQPL